MTITDKQRERRRNYVCASDIAAIIGCSPWKSSRDIWMEKVYGTRPKVNQAQEFGNYQEDGVIRWTQDDLGGVAVNRNQFRVHNERKYTANFCAAHLDAIIMMPDGHDKEGIEAKVTGGQNEFGEGGTADVPEYVKAQVQFQMLCACLEVVHVGAQLPFSVYSQGQIRLILGMDRFPVPRDDDYIAFLYAAAEEFWFKNVKEVIPPEDTLASMETIKQTIRIPEKSIHLGSEVVQEWEHAKASMKQAEYAELAAKAELLQELGNAEIGFVEVEDREVTYFTQSKRTYSPKGKEDKCSQCGIGRNTSTYPVLRSRKAKPGRKFLTEST